MSYQFHQLQKLEGTHEALTLYPIILYLIEEQPSKNIRVSITSKQGPKPIICLNNHGSLLLVLNFFGNMKNRYLYSGSRNQISILMFLMPFPQPIECLAVIKALQNKKPKNRVLKRLETVTQVGIDCMNRGNPIWRCLFSKQHWYLCSILKMYYNYFRIQIKEMNISFSVFASFSNTANIPSQNDCNGSQYTTEGFLQLLSSALKTSISEYSKTVCCTQENKTNEFETDSMIQIEEPENPPRNPEILGSQKIKNNLEGGDNSEEIKGIVPEGTYQLHSPLPAADKPSNQPTIFRCQPSQVENQNRISQQPPQSWQEPTKCPIIGITSSQIQIKRANLLQRHVNNWDHNSKKKKQCFDIKSREVRMLLN